MATTWWRYLGRVPYDAGIALQARVAAEREAGVRPDTLLLLEHPPTYTLGRRAGGDDVRWAESDLDRRGIRVVRVGRGGGTTYHGPGQLVGYPIVRLAHGGRAVRGFVEAIEDLLVDVAARVGVVAARRAGHPGIWAGGAKLGSIGIEIHRGVSRHGFALNVDMDLEPFQGIVPCGVPGLAITALARLAPEPPTVPAVARLVVEAWRERLGEVREEEWPERTEEPMEEADGCERID
jgi:lipoate-protein ligase B